jgi:hypothetical protein
VLEDVGKLECSMIILVYSAGALLLIQLDETLPCLRIRAQVGCFSVSGLGKVDLVLLIESKGFEYKTGRGLKLAQQTL